MAGDRLPREAVEAAAILSARLIEEGSGADRHYHFAKSVGTTLLAQGEPEISRVLGRHGLDVRHVISVQAILLNEEKLPFSDRTLRRFLANKSAHPRIENSIYFYLMFNYSRDLSEIEEQVSMRIEEPLVRELRIAFNHGGRVSRADVDPFIGQYELVHAFHLDPSQAIAASLSIGTGSHKGSKLRLFDAVLKYDYDAGGVRRKQEFTGKIVKHGTSATLLLSDDRKSHMIFYVDYWQGPGPLEVLNGVLIGDVSGHDRASAWPFSARRLAEGEHCQPRTLALDELAAATQQELRRGAVHWDPSRYNL